ncbi:MAG: GNAT family N-acetyltransferase [Anaerolineae bacterium]|nr:GNAT family N-acetyltransferase [Anaerolineae bacterium]
MIVSIRVADPAADYPLVAELLTLVDPQPITAAMLHEWDRRQAEGQIRRRAVATTGDGAIVAYSIVLHEGWKPTGRFLLWLMVDPAARHQGIGLQVYDEALQFAKQQGAQVLESEVRDNEPTALQFAHQRGFEIERHVYRSVLPLAHFDDGPFAGAIEKVEAQGIRFTTLLAEGDTETARRKLHTLNYQTSADDPANTSGKFPDFDEFNQIISGGAWFNPAGQILAVDGNKYVGLAAVGTFEHTMHNMMTGVDREYRGRGIAQALKLLTVYYAQAMGADAITTDNDSQNAPMLAINHRMGYIPQPGVYRLICRLS